MERRWNSFYPKSVSPQTTIPLISLYELLERTALQYPSQIAVIDGDKTSTYAQLKEAVDRLASAMHRRGFQKGDRVAIMLPNCVEYIISNFATQRLGGTAVQVNPMYTPTELEHILRDSEPAWFISEGGQHTKLEQIGLVDQIVFIQTDDPNEGISPFYQWIGESGEFAPIAFIDPKEDVALLQYTGGTTGRSKGVMLTHFNLIANVYLSYSVYTDLLTIPGERMLGIPPFFHISGIVSLNRSILIAGTLITVRRFQLEQAVELILKHRPTVFPGLPTLYVALLSHPELDNIASSFKFCTSGTAPLPMEVVQKFKEKTGQRIIEIFGLSEGLITHQTPRSAVYKQGSIGIPLPGTDAKIVDLHTGTEELPPGQTGEFIIKGPGVMKGYWKNPEDTAATIRNGWLYTGDLATMDEDGYFFIVGRKKEMIIASGYNVYPQEVEEVLYRHEGVAEACVFGIPDPYRGETVKAIILPKKPELTVEEMMEWCNQRLARYKVPRVIEFRHELPKSAVGKILRRVLIEEEKKKHANS